MVDAWITSGGSYNGCMKVVGEAFKDNALAIDPDKKVVVLGIANWSTVTNRDLLINVRNKRDQVKLKGRG